MKEKESIAYILTDVLPNELPLIFSNKKYYNFLVNNSSFIISKENYKEIVKDGTIPTVFKISKSQCEYRNMSLMHPYMQMVVSKFMYDYSNIITIYFQQNKLFSIRVPVSLNNNEIVIGERDTEEIKNMIDSSQEEYDLKLEPIVTHFFNLSRFAKITDFYKSYYLKDLEIKFKLMMKMDISNCFGSIYTHSVDWAYLGNKDIAKANIGNKNRFSYIIDVLMQHMNYRETNGILVGPEFSRLFAEIILTELDNQIYDSLKNMNLFYKKDYEIVRFIDDIFIFSSSRDALEKIEEVIRNIYLEYKLILNDKKMYIENVPFMREHMWVQKIKILINKFSTYSSDLKAESKKIEFENFLEGMRSLIVDYENHKGHIISYTITTLESVQKTFLTSIHKLKEVGEIQKAYLFCSKYIDLITQIVSLSIGHDNIVKVCRMYMKFIKVFDDVVGIDIDELVYKKSYLLLNYHRERWTELQNLLLVLSRLRNKNLPPEFLLDILKSDKGYLSLSVITYYIRTVDVKGIYYDEVYCQINIIIKRILDDCSDIYGFDYQSNKCPKEGRINQFVESDNLYVIHDFYSSGVLDKENIKKINKIKFYIGKRSNGLVGNKSYAVFLRYIKDFDKPFMQWNITENDLITDFFLQKQYKNISYN
jgi:hypothetical protein